MSMLWARLLARLLAPPAPNRLARVRATARTLVTLASLLALALVEAAGRRWA